MRYVHIKDNGKLADLIRSSGIVFEKGAKTATNIAIYFHDISLLTLLILAGNMSYLNLTFVQWRRRSNRKITNCLSLRQYYIFLMLTEALTCLTPHMCVANTLDRSKVGEYNAGARPGITAISEINNFGLDGGLQGLCPL